ncbi:MAG TPA: hypothetical protein VLL54_01130 [Pyrinomonadaceae bacterium]|nr:hypothetical protein [Pyrinomonadaceae bacterium]
MRKKLFASAAVSLLFLFSANAQEKPCPDVPGQTSATYRFRREGEKIEIPLRTNGDDCEPVSLALHWTNGRNNGSNLNVTFLDGYKRPIYARQISAFLTGVMDFPLTSFDRQPVYGASLELISVPTIVRIQTVSPFAGSAELSYNIMRIARTKKRETAELGSEETIERGRGDAEQPGKTVSSGPNQIDGNEIVSIHDVVRLIGATRLPLVQIELKTSHPFPVRDVPLQLQIGKRVFAEELSGDYTGRKLTLSLTPEIFAALNDGDEVVAFFANTTSNSEPPSTAATGEVWHFGKLRKGLKTDVRG